jgi:hypothetical protein
LNIFPPCEGLEIEYESSKGSPAHIYLSLGKPGDRDKLVEAMMQQQELQVKKEMWLID